MTANIFGRIIVGHANLNVIPLLNKHVVSELVQGMKATTLLFPLKPAAFGTAIILPSKLAASVTIIILGTTTLFL